MSYGRGDSCELWGGIHVSHGRDRNSCEPWKGVSIHTSHGRGDSCEPWEAIHASHGGGGIKSILLLVFLPFLNQLFSVTF